MAQPPTASATTHPPPTDLATNEASEDGDAELLDLSFVGRLDAPALCKALEIIGQRAAGSHGGGGGGGGDDAGGGGGGGDLPIGSGKRGRGSGHVTVVLTTTGCKFVIDHAQQYQASASDMFSEFSLKDEYLQFTVDFDTFLECAHIFGAGDGREAVAVTLAYNKGGDLVMFLHYKGMITQCTLHTIEQGRPMTDYAALMRNNTLVNKAQVQSHALREALAELDWAAKTAELTLSPDPPHFSVTTQSMAASATVSLPKSGDVFDSFEARQAQVNRYEVTSLQPAIRALALADKTELKQTDSGLLLMRHLVRFNEQGDTIMCDYFVAPLVPDTDDNDDGGDNDHAMPEW